MPTIIATDTELIIDNIVLTSAQDVKAFIESHQPADLSVPIAMHRPSDLLIRFIAGIEWSITDIYAYLNIHEPTDLLATIIGHSPADLGVFLEGYLTRNLNVNWRIWQTAVKNLWIFLDGTYTDYQDIYALIHIWQVRSFQAQIGMHLPNDLNLLLHIWTTLDLSAFIGSHAPLGLPLYFEGMPEAGINIPADFNISEISSLQLNYYCMDRFKDLVLSFSPAHYTDLGIDLSSFGGYVDLEVPLNGRSGHRELYITLRPNLRRVSLLLPFHTMEFSQLFVSINYGFPCGWGTGYKNLFVYMISKPLVILSVYLHGIRGRETRDFSVYINTEFPWYMDSYPLTFNIASDPFIVFDLITLNITTNISDYPLFIDRKWINFLYPRRKVGGGLDELAVSLFAEQIKWRDLSIKFKAWRPLPAIFSATTSEGGDQEIYLWQLDPPELVRVVEVLFEQQVHEYIWVGAEQKAYSRELWEKWCLMTKSYKPHEIYAGQIDYITLKTLCNLQDFDTIDEAIRYLIDDSPHTGSNDFSVLFNARQSRLDLGIMMNIWPGNKIAVLDTYIVCTHVSDLAISLTPSF